MPSKLTCPACGSFEVQSSKQIREVDLGYADSYSYERTVDRCSMCFTAGDFGNVDGKAHDKALEKARSGQAKQGLVIRSGPHALRFYEQDGWTRSKVQSLVYPGDLLKHFSFDESPYFVLERGSFNEQKLLDACSEFKPAHGESDLKRLREFF